MKQNWYRKTIAQVYNELHTTADGLTDQAVVLQRQKYGWNTLPEAKGESYAVIFAQQFKSPLIYILLGVTVIMAILGETADATIIGLVLVFNAVIGTVQEGKAQNTLAALKNFVKGNAVVRRRGEEEVIPDEELVPGDTIVLREGDKVPADCRLVLSTGLKVDEASLTGESEPVLKTIDTLAEVSGHELHLPEQTNMLFKGTHVVAGGGEAVVVTTGVNTVIGSISQAVATTNTEIPLQGNIRHLSRLIIIVVGCINIALFLLGVLTGKSVVEMFKIVVSLSVSIIPEGLPVVMTLVLANGVWRMSKRRALVKKLAAVEALGQANVIAVDKTGTITKNELVVQKLYVSGKTFDVLGSGFEPRGDILENGTVISALSIPELVLAGKVASRAAAELQFVEGYNAWRILGDPTEGALVVLAEKIGFKQEDIRRHHSVIQEIPFDYKKKYHASVHREEQGYLLTVVGAPEAVFALANKPHDHLSPLLKSWAAQGLRILAFGMKEVHGPVNPDELPHITFGGLFAMRDTLHPEVPEAVADVTAAGIQVVMITGDHTATAQAIARDAGIFHDGDHVVTGADLEEWGPAELQHKLSNTAVFARVTPEDKFRIVQAFQKRGDIIAMTGDGVNDVPSLVAADLGVAMGKIGTEVAKEAADIVLLDDNFATIAAAVEEGRNIYITIKRAILYLFSTSIGELFAIVIGLALGYPLPVLAVQVLWLNFVTDGFLTVAFAMEPKEGNLLRQKFTKPNKYLVDKTMIIRMIPMGLVMAVGTIAIFRYFAPVDYVKATTIAMTLLAVFQWFNAWNCRSEKKSILRQNPFSNPWLLAATAIVIILQILALQLPFLQKILHTTSLSAWEWAMIVLMATSVIIIEELRKFLSRHKVRLL
jgi:P-type Ca2+ transporter type 2C